MSTLRSVGIGLLASLLVGAVVPSAALAKKPGSDPPPPKPVTYNLVWLEGPGYTTRALGRCMPWTIPMARSGRFPAMT